VLPFCESGLIPRLAELAKGDNVELVLASLKVLRLTLRQSRSRFYLLPVACSKFDLVFLLCCRRGESRARRMQVVVSADAACRLSTRCNCKDRHHVHRPVPSQWYSKSVLPFTYLVTHESVFLRVRLADNLAEMLRLGCIEVFLRFMTPASPNADAVIFALSLIADETDTIFPREQTTTTLGRMLETLRGAAKRSAAASATSLLFASLAKSSLFHAVICTEPNLGILAKLLVGGSPEVLGSTAFALGIVALHANDRVRQLLFQVDAPQNLMQLVILSLSSSGPGRDEKVARLAIFALATVTSEALISRAGPLVRPELLLPSAASEPLRISTLSISQGMQGTDFLPHV
jgi:hypothetical protein